MSDLSFNCALVTGGGGGLGKAIARYLLSQGKKVIIAGRTEQTLQQTAREIGATDYFVLDTGLVAQIPKFIRNLTQKYPEVDCLVNNAGVQRPLDIVHDTPADFLTKADQEININIRGPMHLTLGLLEHFRTHPHGATIMNVSSVLGFVPFSVINPVYNGTKAWLHFWSMTLRTQLEKAGYEKIRVVEIVPPSVGTDLHRDRSDPDDNKKHKNPNALSVEEFMEFFVAGVERGESVIAPGMSRELVDAWYREFGPVYEKFAGDHQK
ncbi:putative short-chain dehydrogenases/reductase [Aspergillus saccharolyticus JOP 1030-1]|uniref:Putative short-chain dehydrogenases/reductase n=1 Tax=Aspergillus saccharolyticus JOP 1030-1 TaxID=1450539 RepID=A0A318Z2D5_9EURO|nr:putative short-chain dehydrogenases/reductase [Aspergillus saccharolyticus JOP 1030-1]PYH40457.1 putative short-chain dehydrogenases/reductase [Aspergillus saccharolyticus JOP 1030-1]